MNLKGNHNHHRSKQCLQRTQSKAWHSSIGKANTIDQDQRRSGLGRIGPELRPNGELFSPMQRQNEITSLVQQHLSSLPTRDIPLFDRYSSIQVCHKDIWARKWLYYLDQFTKGQQRALARICLHMIPELGYHKVKQQLHNILAMNTRSLWYTLKKALSSPPVRNGDVKALQSFHLFLRGCCNVIEEYLYIQELGLPSNNMKDHCTRHRGVNRISSPV